MATSVFVRIKKKKIEGVLEVVPTNDCSHRPMPPGRAAHHFVLRNRGRLPDETRPSDCGRCVQLRHARRRVSFAANYRSCALRSPHTFCPSTALRDRGRRAITYCTAHRFTNHWRDATFKPTRANGCAAVTQR